MTILYHDGNRRLQDQFDSRRIADRLEQVTTRTAFTDADKTFIESQCFFFLATATAEGHPTCNLKGGNAGFVRVAAPDELVFPDYDGNGMFLSIGNISANPNIGLLFIDFEKQKRLRVNGTAHASREDPLIKHTVGTINCSSRGARDFPELPALHPQDAARRTLGLHASQWH
jgi:predicted pyridoxine 5'-phosphate oxidase superfamily flavin-nucleotide-binding protein